MAKNNGARKRNKASHGEGHLTRRKRNGKPYGNYFIKYYEDGRHCSKNLDTTDYVEAKRLWHEWVLSREKQNGRPFSDKVEVITWMNAYMDDRHRSAFTKRAIKPATYRKYADVVGHFIRFLKDNHPRLQMCDLSTEVFDDYMMWRSTAPRKPAVLAPQQPCSASLTPVIGRQTAAQEPRKSTIRYRSSRSSSWSALQMAGSDAPTLSRSSTGLNAGIEATMTKPA